MRLPPVTNIKVYNKRLTLIRTITKTFPTDSYPSDISITSAKTIYVSTYCVTNSITLDLTKWFYHSSDTTWAEKWTKTRSNELYLNHILIDNSENIFIGACANGYVGGDLDVSLINYDSSTSNSNTVFSYRFDGVLGDGLDEVNALTASTDGNIYLAGRTMADIPLDYYSLFLKYNVGGTFPAQKMATSSILSSMKRVLTQFELSQNYPNPFNPTTLIKFSLPENSKISLKIYNTLGQEVVSLFENKEYEKGEHEIIFDASHLSSGIYFYHTTTPDGKFNEVKKMVLMK